MSSSSINIYQTITKNPQILSDKLLAFTLLTVNSLLLCTKNKTFLPQKQLPPLKVFINDFYKRANLPCAVHLFTLIYLLRLKSKLPKNACGGYDTPYRIFLAAVLTSSKYLSETGTELTSTNVSYLTCQIYTPKDINQMERSFLVLLRYNLWVSLSEVEFFLDAYGDKIHFHANQSSVSDNNSSSSVINSTNGNSCVEDVLLVPKPVLPPPHLA